MPPKILLVGCGITSVFTGKLLQSQFESISIWEKCNEPGGRFSTVSGGKFNQFSTDLGAQYITTTDETMNSFKDIYSSLSENKVIAIMKNRIKGMKQLSKDKKNFVAPLGMKSVVNHFLEQTCLDISYRHKLISLDCKSNRWLAITDSGKEELFDIVVLTMPVPELMDLSGYVKALVLNDTVISNHLRSVKYSSRFALGLFFDEDVHTDCDSEYIDGDSIVRFVGTDCWKRDNKDIFRTAVIHTTIQFGEEHKEHNLLKVQDIIVKRVEEIFQHWPKPSSIAACLWKYSQVVQPFNSKPGAITLSEEPLLIAGGDGFVGSTFDQCLFSAKRISEIIFNKYPLFSNNQPL